MSFISQVGTKITTFKPEVFKTGGTVLGTLILAFIGIKIGDFLIDRLLRPREKMYIDEGRILTLRTLTKSILRYATYFIVGFTILGQLVKDPKGFLAGAGILGVALGFGAQSLVKDVVTGFFILLENQYSVGEYISTGNFSGFVEEVGIRITKLRDWGGEYHIIPNGQITAVTNFSRGNMRAVVEVPVAYEADVDNAIDVMKRVAEKTAYEMKEIITEGPEVLGVVSMGSGEVIIRTVAKTKPMEQWGVERELRKRFKEAFEEAGIETPRRIIISSEPGVGKGVKSPS